jgi:cytochrome c556
VRKSLAGALVVIVLAAGCGGEKHAQPTTSRTTTVRSPLVRALIRDYRRLDADVRRLRADATKVHRRTLLGTPAFRRDTGRFIDDLERSHLSPKARNREIDHGAAAVATSCEQCFQQLEAIRPIPQIAGH